MLILPGDPDFDLTLSTALTPGWHQVAAQQGMQVAFVADAATGLLRPATNADLDDYLFGGEYDERLSGLEQADELDLIY